MSVRADKPKTEGVDASAILNEAATTDASLGEGNSYCVASPDNPLKRNLVVSIRASLNDLCLSKSKGTWQPSSEALKSIFQQKKFTSLDGAADAQGDLKSVVLHDLKVQHTSSSFPVCKCHARSHFTRTSRVPHLVLTISCSPLVSLVQRLVPASPASTTPPSPPRVIPSP